MFSMRMKTPFFWLLILGAALLMGACTPSAEPAPTVPAGDTPIPTLPQPTPTVTPTPEPAAVVVNGERVTLAEFEEELARFTAAQEALGQTVSADAARERVLNELIEQTLMAQAAVEGGFQVNDAQVTARIDALAEKLGGADALRAWWERNGYTEDSLRRALARQMAAAWQREQLAASVGKNVEQVHARQILAYQRENAEKALEELRAGADFATIAARFDPQTGGELGWFPRGYLLQPAVEEAAFSLEPMSYSEIIETPLGFHIVQVLERGASHALTPDARLRLAEEAVAKWLKEARAKAAIEVLTP